MNPIDVIPSGINMLTPKQLVDLMDDRELTPEQVDKIIPHTKEFLSDVKEILIQQTEIDKLHHDKYVDNSFRIIDNLLKSMDEVSTVQERKLFLETINNIHHRISDIQKNEKNHNNLFKTIMGILGSMFMLVVVILTAGKIRRD